MPSPADQLDTRIEIVTPENIAFQYDLAGPFRRLPAFAIDVLLRVAICIVAFFSLALAFGALGAGEIGVGLGMVVWFLLAWFYGGVFETLWNGQTPGKRLMGLRVVSVTGRPIEAWQAVLRNILREVDIMPVAFGMQNLSLLPLFTVGLVAMAVSRRFQRLGDLPCGTMVIVEQNQHLRGVVDVSDPAVVELAERIPAGFVVSRSMARSLSAYVERRRYFGAGRRAEIARTVGEPLCERFGLPRDTSHDLLLGALYYRAFIANRGEAPRERAAPAPAAGQPRRPEYVFPSRRR